MHVERERLAALDIGSNTVVLLVAEVHDGRLHQVGYYSELPRVGAELHDTGAIGAERMRVALDAITSVLAHGRVHGYRRVAAGATAAVRRASDGGQFLEAVKHTTALDVRLIDEELEARLSFRGVASANAVDGTWLMLDLGGASTEVVVANGREMVAWASAEIGSGSFSARYLVSDPPSDAERGGLRAAAAEALRRMPDAENPSRFALTGTTPLRRVLPREGEGTVTRVDVDSGRERLNSATAQEVGEDTGLGPERVHALRGAVEIIDAALERYAMSELVLSWEGVPHGMILALAEKGEEWYLAGR